MAIGKGTQRVSLEISRTSQSPELLSRAGMSTGERKQRHTLDTPSKFNQQKGKLNGIVKLPFMFRNKMARVTSTF